MAIFCHRLAAELPVTIYGSGLQCRDFLCVFDLVDGLLLLLDDGPSGAWNVSSGTETTIIELLAELERLLGVTAVVDWQPRGRGGRPILARVRSAAARPGLAAPTNVTRRASRGAECVDGPSRLTGRNTTLEDVLHRKSPGQICPASSVARKPGAHEVVAHRRIGT